MPGNRRTAGLPPVRFEEAIAFARSREVKLPADYYDERQTASRAEAFTISNLTSLREIQSVLDLLNKVMESGATFADFVAEVEAQDVYADPAHLETVYRTAVQTAYNIGRTAQQQAAKGSRPILMYDAINDSRTRPNHRAMDGFMAPVDHPVWSVWTPPCGFNCRCSLISLTEAQATARGFTGFVKEPTVQPDEGFGYDKRNRAAYDQTLNHATGDAKAETPEPVQRASGKAMLKRPGR